MIYKKNNITQCQADIYSHDAKQKPIKIVVLLNSKPDNVMTK